MGRPTDQQLRTFYKVMSISCFLTALVFFLAGVVFAEVEYRIFSIIFFIFSIISGSIYIKKYRVVFRDPKDLLAKVLHLEEEIRKRKEIFDNLKKEEESTPVSSYANEESNRQLLDKEVEQMLDKEVEQLLDEDVEIIVSTKPRDQPKIYVDDETKRAKIVLKKEAFRCDICKRTITEGIVNCPNCDTSFHYRCLGEWIKTHGECPRCKTELAFQTD